MIVRIVKLSIDPNSKEGASFRRLFLESKEHIVGQAGCHKVVLLEAQTHFFTHSTWDSEEALNDYRKSDLFGVVWPQTKALFYDKPEAWTCHIFIKKLLVLLKHLTWKDMRSFGCFFFILCVKLHFKKTAKGCFFA